MSVTRIGRLGMICEIVPLSEAALSPSATLNSMEIEGKEGFCSSTGGDGGD